nr:hypothetical protein [Polyangiaceae bacterium]
MTQNNTPESPAIQTSDGPVDDQFLQELLKTDPSKVDEKLRANGVDESAWADVKKGISLLRQADESILDAMRGGSVGADGSLAAHSVIPRGNALRFVRGGAVSFFSIVLLMIVMGKSWQSRWGVIEGIFLLAIAAWGVLDFVGSFDDKETPSSITKLSDLAAPIAMLIASVGVFAGGIAGGHANVILPQLGWGIVTTLGFIAMAASVFQIGWRMGIVGLDESGVH